MQAILKYIILLNSFLLMGLSFQLSAQEKKDTTTVKTPIYQGFTVEIDLMPLAEAALTKGVSSGVQGNLQFNLKRTFFPVIEIGYGGAEKSLENGTSYSGRGMYEKIGIDFNLIKQKTGGKLLNNFFLAGVRLGMSHFNYDINNISTTDDYWGGSYVANEHLATTRSWVEVVAGLRVEVYKNIVMGWNVRNKHLLGSIENGKVYPYYIQGYGKTASTTWGFSYVIGYRF